VAGDLTAVTVAGNVGVGTLSGVGAGLAAGDLAADFVAPSFSGVLPNDVYPRIGSHLIGAADPVHAVTVADDFNGVMRAGSLDVGAYVFQGDGPPLGDGFKPPLVTADGGAPPDAKDDAGRPSVFSASGCGCRTAPAAGGWGWLPLAVMVMSRRRRTAPRLLK
jgi:MYXO-CTERM domain-containing protein